MNTEDLLDGKVPTLDAFAEFSGVCERLSK